LANLIERLSILYPDGIVDIQDLPDKYRPVDIGGKVDNARPRAVAPGAEIDASHLPRIGLDLKEHLTQIESQLIRQALDESDWVVAHAAKRLQMGRTTLVEKMRKLNLQRHDEVSSL